MPGHKGTSFLGCEPFDVTEIKGADDLFHAEGVIAESERNAATLFGAGATFYSTEGATLPIKAMLALAVQNAPKTAARPRILATRNAHKAFLYGCALLDIDVDWLHGESGHLCECQVSASMLESALQATDAPYCAVFVTSPDYLGNILDIASLAKVCKRHGVPLLVDNAHGAYTAFSRPVCHPMALGATMCADSAHKTLPALTGTAYLHIAMDAPQAFFDGARAALAMFASSSPSYLLLQSLDLCNAYLANEFPAQLADCTARVAGLKELLCSVGYELLGNEPLKLVVDGRARGYTGEALADALREGGVEPEFVDRDCVVLMCTPQNTDEELSRVALALCALSQCTELPKTRTVMPHNAEKALSIRKAMLAAHEKVAANDAAGRICATPCVSCPPAIPIAVSGERITGEHIALFKAYGIEEIDVVK
jgi:arginine/lysine/ornithine decarboxylase